MVMLSLKLSIVVSILFIILLTVWIIGAVMEVINKKKHVDTLHERVVDSLLDKVDDDRPIVLSVNQEKLVERIVNEMETRECIKSYTREYIKTKDGVITK